MQFESFRAFADGGATAGAERVTAANGAYHHFEISLRSASGTTTATLVIDGAPAATQALPSEAPTTITLAVGAPFTSGANLNATIWIDNVIVERL